MEAASEQDRTHEEEEEEEGEEGERCSSFSPHVGAVEVRSCVTCTLVRNGGEARGVLFSHWGSEAISCSIISVVAMYGVALLLSCSVDRGSLWVGGPT